MLARKTGLILSMLLLLAAAPAVFACAEHAIPAAPGQEFTLKKGQSARIGETGLMLTITDFYNSPCPEDVQCIWSGVGIGLEYRYGEKTQKGIDLSEAFGYRTKIVDTDYETHADLIVDKIEDK